MTSADLERACQQLTGGNVSAFCREVGITRPAYYRALKNGPSELTALKVERVMNEGAIKPQRRK